MTSCCQKHQMRQPESRKAEAGTRSVLRMIKGGADREGTKLCIVWGRQPGCVDWVGSCETEYVTKDRCTRHFWGSSASPEYLSAEGGGKIWQHRIALKSRVRGWAWNCLSFIACEIRQSRFQQSDTFKIAFSAHRKKCTLDFPKVERWKITSMIWCEVITKQRWLPGTPTSIVYAGSTEVIS